MGVTVNIISISDIPKKGRGRMFLILLILTAVSFTIMLLDPSLLKAGAFVVICTITMGYALLVEEYGPIKDAPFLLPHIRNTDYKDADGSYPEYKGQVRTHYKILNRGDWDSKSWKMYIAKNGSEEWSVVDKDGFSFYSKKEGTLVPAHGERGPFVPSIIRHDDRYDNFNGLMLARITYTDVMDKEYCTCQWYNNGIENGTYINTEAERRKTGLFKRVKSEGECKDCRWEKLVAK